LKHKPKDSLSIYLDFQKLAEQDPKLADELLDSPDDTINALNIVLNDKEPSDKKLYVRAINLPDSQKTTIGQIRSKHLDKFHKIKGCVYGVGEIRPNCMSAKFECPSCGNVLTILQSDDKFKQPTRCGCGRKGKFILLNKELSDTQLIILEEVQEELGRRIDPKRLPVLLKGDLVNEDKQHYYEDSSTPIIINGIVREIPKYNSQGKQLATFDLIIEANNIEFQNEDEEILSQEDIKEIHDKKPSVEELISSFAPHIFGNHNEKKGVLLGIVSGGNEKQKDDRDDCHILIAGDPSTSKSQLLNEGKQITFRSQFISGKGTSAVGLIGGIEVDEHLKKKTAKKGVLAMANKSVVFHDELDKADSRDRDALHEPLEAPQKANINKNNIHKTFETDCSYIAACNPKYGKFIETDEPMIEQINLPATLISRFDLIFGIRNIPDREQDKNKFQIMAAKKRNKIKPKYDTTFLSKYIYYAKYHIKPILTKECIDVLEEYYVNKRSESTTKVKLYERQAEGLMRLSMAHAKLCLRDKTTKEDACRIINLFEYSMLQLGIQDAEQIEYEHVFGKEELAYFDKMFSILKKNDDEGKVRIEALKENLGERYTEDKIKSIIEDKKNNKELYEPQKGILMGVEA